MVPVMDVPAGKREGGRQPDTQLPHAFPPCRRDVLYSDCWTYLLVGAQAVLGGRKALTVRLAVALGEIGYLANRTSLPPPGGRSNLALEAPADFHLPVAASKTWSRFRPTTVAVTGAL